MRSIFRGRGAVSSAGTLGYRRPATKTYTDACEAPEPFWRGAIASRHVMARHADNTYFKVPERTYSHPPETKPTELDFRHVNSMYCLGNDDLVATYPEGLPGKVMQLMPPGHPRGFLFRKQSFLLNQFIHKLSQLGVPGVDGADIHRTLFELSGNRPGLIVDGATGTGKSALMAQAVHYARSRGVLTFFVPNAKDWTHGEWCWPSVLLPGFWDAPDAARQFLGYLARAHRDQLQRMPLTVTPHDLPVEATAANEKSPKTWFDLCEWGAGAAVGAPSNIDRQSVAVKYLFDEIQQDTRTPMLFVVDGMNLFSQDTHYRYPHPDFLKSLTTLQGTDVDLYPQELPRIPAARFTFVRGLNKIMLDGLNATSKNKFFITATTRDFKPFDGGVSGFPDREIDRWRNSLDEYAPFHAEKDTILHPMSLQNFDEYEYRSFLRFLINSGELAGFGWGPMWHYSSDFERKLYKIEFMSERNPQRVVDHYHQEITWVHEYGRIRQKQMLIHRESQKYVKRTQVEGSRGLSTTPQQPRFPQRQLQQGQQR